MCSKITTTLKQEAEKKSDVIYSNIISYCKSSNSPFIDDSFLHNKKSIGSLQFTKNGVKRHEEPDFLNWLRPSQMFTKDGRSSPWSVLNNPRPSDIEQGTLVGDCWLMSAMALIAERPDVLDDIIPKKQYSHYGVYQIKLCVEGKWEVIIVDDFFPCYSKTNSIAMAVGRRNQLWVPLIEKAMAKVLGSYSKLHGASLAQGLSMLTGASCVNYNCPPIPSSVDDVDTFWAQLVSSKESGFLMCCHCGAFENVVAEAEFKAMGLLTNHAYSILDVIYEQGYRLLRIRNPWGQFVWNGKWSDGWPGWPIGMKQKFLNQRKDETGAFWMDLEDFVARFASVTVCKLRMDWSELRVTHKVGGHSDTALQIVITDTCEVSVTAFQKGAFNKKDNLNDLMVCVHRISGDRRIGELIEMSSRISDNHFTIDEFFLAPGEYQIVCHSQSSLLTNKKGVVNMVVHTRYPIFGEYIPMSPRTRMESLHHVIIKEGDIVKNTNDGVVIRTLTRKFRGMIIMADNCLEKKYLHVGVDCSQSMNIQSSRGFLQVVDVVPPLCRQVLLVLSTIDDSAQYRVSNSLKTLVHRSKCLLPEMWYEAAISAPNAQHYPLLNTSSFDPIHSTVSVF
ncbi:Calpain catalytic domain-containing protein [Caenorhabditis elegans]|nr:Calpain catalytic domain-containing protein [Caenorhabditis elegans]CBZ42128.1 Calpain catalytic domain-containing protein [Caenorhabditis elegans]|eukprot:NP_001256151.1 CaLPain family [Caenorhabditis elegans]